MKVFYLVIITLLISVSNLKSQNLYTLANAANIPNEVNATTGWTGPANITSVTNNPNLGTYCLRIVSVSGGGRNRRFTFPATVGSSYTISIYARRGSNSTNPAFTNWSGFTGFTSTPINSQSWTEYTFNVTATATNPEIRVYAAQSGSPGKEVFIDAISITLQGGGDTQAPTAPTNLAASNTTATGTTLNWTASTDNVGVTAYQIRQNNVMVGSVAGNVTTYNATGLTASTTYSFNVVALDAANNVSPASNTVQVTTTSGGGDTQAPTAPTNLAASNTTSSGTTLNWTASTDNVGVTAYQIRQNNVMVGSVAGNITTYNATGLTASTTYSFNVVALDAANNVSPASNTVQVTTTSGGGGGTSYTTLNANLPSVNWQGLNWYGAGNMGIGTPANSNFRLAVNGVIRSKELTVDSGWSDFVFEPGYKLPSLKEVEKEIELNGHLKDIPSAQQVRENGVGLAEINKLLLQKIEEMTLYLIDANKRLNDLEQEEAKIDREY